MKWGLVALVCLMAGCTQEPTNLFEEAVEIQPGSFAEFNTEMEAGDTLHWSWTASSEVPWDLHSHAGRDVEIHQQGTAEHAEGSFTAQQAGTYSLFWDNQETEPVSLSYKAWGDHTFKSSVP